MISVNIPEPIIGTTQLIAVFWIYDKVTRIVLERVKNRDFKASVMGLRIHHWLIGIIVTIIGFIILYFQNVVMLYESGLVGIPGKLSSGTVTMGFRIFIDDLKDLKRQVKNFFS
ncbi:MAG: hypothetical protein ACUVQ0_02755 [Thermoproteota archaeon]